LRPEGPNIETQRAESGGGVLGEGEASPLPPVRGLGSAASSPTGSGAEPQPKSNLVYLAEKSNIWWQLF